MNKTSSIDLSIVIPFFNEQECVASLLSEITQVMKDTNLNYEIICIDDGSHDATADELKKAKEKNSHISNLSLARNYGQTAALSAGFDAASGQWILCMDGDGQNDPQDIPRFIEKIDDQIDLVSGWRKHRSETSIERTLPSKCVNALVRKLSNVNIHDLGCTMKLYRKSILDDIHLYGEMHRFIPLFVQNAGGRIIEIEVNHKARLAGQSKYGLERVFKVLMDLFVILFFTTVRDKPIYLFGGVGLIECLLGILFVLTSIIFKIIDFRDFVETPLPNMGMFLIVLGVLTLLIGLLADLMMRTYFESQNKKPYHLKKTD